MGDHAIFAPSSAHRWLLCPASALLAAYAPDTRSQEAKDAADEGTRVHALIEQAVSAGVMPNEIAAESEDVFETVSAIMEFVHRLEPGITRAEQRVTLNDACWGTLDIKHLPIEAKIATIVDYKNGGMHVELVSNEQVLTYAAAVDREFGDDYTHYRLVIVQPNSRTAGEVAPIRQWVVPVADVREHARKVESAIARAKAGEAPKPGAHCRYCPMFGQCAATKDAVTQLSVMVGNPVSHVPDVAIGPMLIYLRGLEDYAKALRSEAMARLAAGRTMPHVVAGTTATHRKWRDDAAAARQLFAEFGIDALEPLSPAQAEKLGPKGKELAALLAFKPPGNASLKLV